ncbi:MAG: hypothetical protein ACK4R7_05075 [Fervidobacterium sp.]
MKLEFYAAFIFVISVFLLVVLLIQKREIIQEEVLPSPFLYLKNPFEKDIKKMKNDINRQLFFLEYGIKVPAKADNFSELVDVLFQVEDPRAKKEVIKIVWKYWWGQGIESVTFKVKHVTIVWFPTIYHTKAQSNYTFGDALYNALNGSSSEFSIKDLDMEVVRLICEKYKVDLVSK